MFYYNTDFGIFWTFLETFIIIMVMETNSKVGKVIVIILILTVILGVGGIVIYNMAKSAELSILVAPSSATIKINGEEYTNGQYKFFPQKNVEVEILSPEYQSQTQTIDLIANETTLLRAVLEDEDGGYDSYLESLETYNQIKMLAPAIGNQKLTDLVNATEKKLAILDILPLSENIGEFYADKHGFIVSRDDNATIVQVMPSSDDCGVVPCLEVYESNGDLSKVKSVLKEKGYDPEAYIYNMQELYLYEPDYDFPDVE